MKIEERKEECSEGSQSRDPSLDAIKAVSISLVLLWHLRPLEFSSAGHGILSMPERVIYFFNHQISLVAVPAFFLVSLTLFLRRGGTKISYLKQRTVRILKIYLFWTAVQITAYCITSVLSSGRGFWNGLTNISPFSLYYTIIGIQPGLPVVGDSVFYFLFNLLILTIGSSLWQRINSRHQGALCWLIVVASLFNFEMSIFLNYKIPYFRLDNFALYIPTAWLLSRARSSSLKQRYLLLAGFVAFSVHDTILQSHGYSWSHYGRISVYLGVLFLFSTVTAKNLTEVGRTIRLLSTYSLGIFALHKYWQLLFIVVVSKLFAHAGATGSIVCTTGFALHLVPLIVFPLTVLFTILSAYLIGCVPRRYFISQTVR